MADPKYTVTDNGRILALGRSDGVDWQVERFDEALAATGELVIPYTKLPPGLRIGDLAAKVNLNLEDGAALVTGINCQYAQHIFDWDGATYHVIRPDFGYLLITTCFEEGPLNQFEKELHRAFFEHREAVFQLKNVIKHNVLDPAGAPEFSWWVDFWKKRGFSIIDDGSYSLIGCSDERNVSPPPWSEKASISEIEGYLRTISTGSQVPSKNNAEKMAKDHFSPRNAAQADVRKAHVNVFGALRPGPRGTNSVEEFG